MTEVSFHFNVLDRTEYTCRLVRKAVRAGANVVLTGPSKVLAHFDRALWTFDPTEFLPHARLPVGAPAPVRPLEASLCLMEDASQALHHEVLVNLSEEPPPGFESFARVIEIVSPEEADRRAARQRWKHYASRGYAIRSHEAPG